VADYHIGHQVCKYDLLKLYKIEENICETNPYYPQVNTFNFTFDVILVLSTPLALCFTFGTIWFRPFEAKNRAVTSNPSPKWN
ncbi:hypothetical protein GBA52_008139, partial [Prunus armeniaca]